VNERTERLRHLSTRLIALHAALLAYQRRIYEAAYGPTDGADLLRKLMEHEQFAWLRALSGLIARIDEALDARRPTAEVDADHFFTEVDRLLRSGGNGTFEIKYRAALQESPDAVIAHAEVVRLLKAVHRSA
jgi:hypothetical protein